MEQLNELFGAETTEQDKVNWFNSVKDKVKENETVIELVRSNPKDQVLHGDFTKGMEDAVLDSMHSHNEIAQQVLGDNKTAREFVGLLLRQLLNENGG